MIRPAAVMLIGGNTGAQGIVTVAGAGSTWTHGGNLVVGAAGDGELTITDGAVVHVGGGTTQVAALAGSTGTLNIGSGAGEAAAAPGILDSAFVGCRGGFRLVKRRNFVAGTFDGGAKA